MKKLEKPLYHGTAACLAWKIARQGFKAPIYLTESKKTAEHYAKAAAAYIRDYAAEHNISLVDDGYSIFSFTEVPDNKYLKVDDYNLDKEEGQWKYIKPLRKYELETYPLITTEEELLRLQCFAIGMWRQ